MRHFTRIIAICFAVTLPITVACASSDESDTGFQPTKDGGKDTGTNTGGTGNTGTGGSGTGGSGATGGSGTGGTATGGTGGGTGGSSTGGSGGSTGSCNVDFCPTPAPPASKCCVTANGPCGVDYGQGQGCQSATNTGGAGP